MSTTIPVINCNELTIAQPLTGAEQYPFNLKSSLGYNLVQAGATAAGSGFLNMLNSSGTRIISFNTGSVYATIGTGSAIESAILVLQSTSKGFLPPRLTSAQMNAISSPATGLIVYNTDLNQICVYVGAKWQKVTQTDV